MKKQNPSTQAIQITSNVMLAKQYTQLIQNKILNALNQSAITISLNQKPFSIVKPKDELNHTQQKDTIQNRLKRLKQEKSKAERILHELQLQQKLFQANIRYSLTPRSKLNCKMHLKSKFTEQDAKNIRSLQKQYREKQKSLENKSKQIEEEEKRMLHEEISKSRVRLQQNKQTKRNEISLKLLEMKNRRQERIKRFEEEKKVINKLKKQKRLYEELQQKWQQIQRNEKMKKLQFYEDRKNNQKVNLQELKEHEKKYEQILIKSKEEQQKRRNKQELSNIVFQRSKFYTLIAEEDEKKKSEMKDRNQSIKELCIKRREYGRQVIINHPPKIRQKSEQNIQENKHKRQRLNTQELRKLGLANLSLSKSLANKNRDKSLNISDINTTTPPKTRKYPDYLTQNKKLRESSLTCTAPKSNSHFDKQLREAKRVMKTTNFSQKQKVQKIKRIAEKIDTSGYSTTQKHKSQVLVNKIAAKIELLETFK